MPKTTGSRTAQRSAIVLAAVALAGALVAEAGTSSHASVAPVAGLARPRDWPRLTSVPPPDPALEARIDAVLARLSPEQKVGQLIQPDIDAFTPADLSRVPAGSILNGGNSKPGKDIHAPPAEWLALADRYYDAAVASPLAVPGVPLLWAVDAVHGHNDIPGATLFPHNIGLGAADDAELVRSIGEATAREVRATGLDWVFSPTLAVVRDLRWGRTYESFGSDPARVARLGAALVLGLQGAPGTPQFLDAEHVLATAKHFLADGATAGHDQGDAAIGEAELRGVHAAGFRAALAAGVQTVMASYSSWQGVKMHGNASLLTGVLKERLGFSGLLIGDWNGHAQLPGCDAAQCASAVRAGLDVLMAPDAGPALYAHTLAQLRRGEIPAARLDDAVRRVLRVKLRAHVDQEARPSARPLAGHFELLGAAAHRALARRAVRESLVLLKNARHTLPLSPRTRVLVCGPAADDIARQSGGWSLTWQARDLVNSDFPGAQSIYAGIRTAVEAAGGAAILSQDCSFAARPDVAIVVYGEAPYAEFEGDIPAARLPGEVVVHEQLIKLRARGVRTVSVLIAGRPLWVDAVLAASDAFVMGWLPGSEGGGIADVLFRAPDGAIPHDFSGHLPLAWPAGPQQTAAGFGAPRFAAGFGLRYRRGG